MIKQTLYFSNPAYLSLKNDQLCIKVNPSNKDSQEVTRPIEDIGVIIMDHGQITITHQAIRALQRNKSAIISCDDSHMPAGLMLPFNANSLQSKVMKTQLSASLPLNKNLWQQTIKAKIHNQIAVLRYYGKNTKRLKVLVERVQSGDPNNIEGQASAYYWKTLIDGFVRDQYGDPPNGMLNYGYAIIRSMVARAIVASGLHPTLGIFHKNQYNAYCLADDIMEPYRPFVDAKVLSICHQKESLEGFLNKNDRASILSVMTADAKYGNKKRPLYIGLSMTTASLVQCYEGKKRKILYPEIIN